jgi:type III secretion protein J
LGVILAALILVGCSNRVDLLASATESEANDVLAVLLKSDISAEKLAKKTGVAVSVREVDVERALSILRQHGLPRERFEGMGQIFHKEGMISSPLEERARYVYALSQELENTLTKMDGVLVARVHVVLPEQDATRASKTVASAAVFIKHQAGYNLDLLRPQIRTLVSHAIPDLGEDRVSVVLVAAHAAMLPAVSAPMAAPATQGTQAQPQGHPAGMSGWWVIGSVVATVLVCLLTALGVLAWRRRRSGAQADIGGDAQRHDESFGQA